MVRIIIQVCLLVAAFYSVSSAETAPSIAWKKKLPSDCYFVTTTGDSIVCVGKTIMVLSQDGSILSQSQSLEDTKTISSNPPIFYFTNDHSFVMVKDDCTIKKISQSAAIMWAKFICDSIPDSYFYGYADDNAGNAYLCGTINGLSGLIFELGNNRASIINTDTTMRSFSSIAIIRDSLFMVSRQYGDPTLTGTGSLVVFDNKGEFARRAIDTGCGSTLMIDSGYIFSLNAQDGAPWLFKRTFSSTADIVLKRHFLNGKLDTAVIFDFGKYESPILLQKFQDGILMITLSDETLSFGTNYWNYFITKLDASLKKQWQLRLGTDTLDLRSDSYHPRYFAVDARGTILATHNDTLFKFVDASTVMQPSTPQNRGGISAYSSSTMKVYDLQGRFLYKYSLNSGPNARHRGKANAAPGLKLLRSGSGSGNEIKVLYFKSSNKE
jgi:hypothetical protein